MPRGLRQKLRKCNFEGTIDGDPSSKISISGCIGSMGTKDISVLSSKVEFMKIANFTLLPFVVSQSL